jgi:hypothetical protein
LNRAFRAWSMTPFRRYAHWLRRDTPSRPYADTPIGCVAIRFAPIRRYAHWLRRDTLSRPYADTPIGCVAIRYLAHTPIRPLVTSRYAISPIRRYAITSIRHHVDTPSRRYAITSIHHHADTPFRRLLDSLVHFGNSSATSDRSSASSFTLASILDRLNSLIGTLGTISQPVPSLLMGKELMSPFSTP